MSQYGGSIPATLVKGALLGSNGQPVLSTEHNPTTGGFGASLRRLIASGIYNGDFNDEPSDGTQINEDNPLPFWTLVQSSGVAFEAYSDLNSTTASGRLIRMVLLPGAASDEGWLEQMVPVNGSQGRSFSYGAGATVKTAAVVNSIQVVLGVAFYLEDGVTSTGTEGTDSPTTTSIGVSTVRDLVDVPNTTGVVPADAYWMRVRVGLARGAAATTDTVTVQLHEVVTIVGRNRILLVDTTDPSQGHTEMRQVSGVFAIRPHQTSGFTITTHAYVEINTSTGDISLMSENDAGIQLDRADGGEPPYIEMLERSADPAAPGVNRGRLFLKDNGAGKTQLCIRFNTGATQVIATQP
jgi:hypothetical protein